MPIGGLPLHGKRMNADSVCVHFHTMRLASYTTGYAVLGHVKVTGAPPSALAYLRTTPARTTSSEPARMASVRSNCLQWTAAEAQGTFAALAG